MHLVHQFEGNVVLNYELVLKSDSEILIYIRSPPWCAHILGSSALS
jgi:hypothetical protein